MKHKISKFALCWVVVGPVWTARGPFSHEDAVREKNSYNSRLQILHDVKIETWNEQSVAKVRLVDGTEIDDEGFPV